jgi:hypothetical protein
MISFSLSALPHDCMQTLASSITRGRVPLSRPTNPRIPIYALALTRCRDARSLHGTEDCAIAGCGNGNAANPAVKGDGGVEDARGGGGHCHGCAGADPHAHAGGAGGEDGEEDGVDIALARRVAGLVGGVIAHGAVGGASGAWVEAVPEGEVFGVLG